ncbi:MAG: leucine-rich repeat domain-containing protein [Clostridia bacterium]|nr:leucine-rich repeat domain-containing protein [Clostridia bacterium]
MRKVLCLIIALLMLSAGGALAEQSEWNFDTVSYALYGYRGAGGALTIPATIGGCTVDIIGAAAFNSANEITAIKLPETVRQIETGAISFCENLACVELNNGLLVIGDDCFVSNSALTELTIPASVCYIGSNSFDSCGSLRRITFQGICPVFAGSAFDWLPKEAVIYVPDDQFDAYSAAFGSMNREFNLQPSGENAQAYDFSNDPELFGIDEATGTLYCFDGYHVRVDVPAQINGVAVRAIDAEAFLNNPYLCYLTLPEGVETIGDSAFEGCTRLVYADLPSTLKHIGNRAFANGLKARSLVLPAGLESIGNEAFYWAVRLTALELPQGLKTIGAGAFDGCSWLEDVSIPDSVESIGEKAFANSGVAYVAFEGLRLPQMPESVFENCWYLADVDLHTKASKQQMLDMQAVVNNLGLTCRVWRMQNSQVDYILDGLDTYHNGVLTGYAGEQTHIRPWDTYDGITVTAVGDGAFANNPRIQYFAVPYNDEFTTIGAEAFAGSALAQIDLFDSVTTIGEGAFRNCAGLRELTLPESVSVVGAEALAGCTGLEKLTVMCDPSVLPNDLLAGCPKTLEIYAAPDATDEQVMYLSRIAGRSFYEPVPRIGEPLPKLLASPHEPLPGEDFWYDADYARLDGYQGYALNLVLPSRINETLLTMIGGGMMQRASYGDNYELELPVVSVVIPESYTNIPAYTFQNCETLETVICYAPIETLNEGTFKNCTALREVIFVNGIGSIGAYVFDNCPNLETVYLGPYVGSVSDYAFMDELGKSLWSLDKCITDPALMPDVEARLAAVKREPMAAPEPVSAPEPIPVGAQGEPFFGLWHGTQMVMNGEPLDLSELEIVLSLMLCEDGRMVFSESETIDMSQVGDGDWYAWYVKDGVAFADLYTMTLLDDGRLCVDENGMQMLFVRGEQGGETTAAAAQPKAEADTPAGASVLTEVRYVCVSAEMEGYTVDASLLGGEYAVILHEGGTVDFVLLGAAIPGLTWRPTEGGGFVIDYFGAAIEGAPAGEGFDMNYFDAMLLRFLPDK